MKIKKGDKVKIMAGKDKGKDGKVIQVFPDLNKVVVEGVNVIKKHLRAQKKGEKGQRIEIPFPVSASNVMLIDPASGAATRVGYRTEGDKKVRFAKKTKVAIE